jgi:hypothetical protein
MGEDQTVMIRGLIKAEQKSSIPWIGADHVSLIHRYERISPHISANVNLIHSLILKQIDKHDRAPVSSC